MPGRGQTAVKHAKTNRQAKRGLGFRSTGSEMRRLPGSWVTGGGKRRQLLRGGASLIRMRSLVQIQVGPHLESLVATGFSAFRGPETGVQMGTAVIRAVKHAKQLPKHHGSRPRFETTPSLWNPPSPICAVMGG
jgi:hypothetical protein